MTEEAIKKLSCHEELKKLIASYFEELKTARDRGHPVAWCTAAGHPELAWATGFTVAFPENHAATCSTRKAGTDLCIAAEERGFSPDLCSYLRVDIGSALMGSETVSPVGGLPRPDLLIMSNNQCDTVTKWYEELSRIFKVPLLLLDVPHRHGEPASEEFKYATGYIRAQLEEQVRFLEDFTGRRFDYDRFKDCVANSGRTGRLWAEIQDLARFVPSPLTCFDLFIHVFPLIVRRGLPEAPAYYELLKAELEDRVAKGIAAVPNEKHRLLWDTTPVWYRLRELATRFNSRQANVISMTSYVMEGLTWLDGDRPLDSMAEGMSFPYTATGYEHRLNFLRNRVKNYSLNGLVMQWSRSCRPFYMGQLDIIETIRREFDVPSLIFEGDLCDSRLYSDDQVNGRIDAFLELLDKKN